MQQIFIPALFRLGQYIGKESNRQSARGKSFKFAKASGGRHVS